MQNGGYRRSWVRIKAEASVGGEVGEISSRQEGDRIRGARVSHRGTDGRLLDSFFLCCAQKRILARTSWLGGCFASCEETRQPGRQIPIAAAFGTKPLYIYLLCLADCSAITSHHSSARMTWCDGPVLRLFAGWLRRHLLAALLDALTYPPRLCLWQDPPVDVLASSGAQKPGW